MTSHLISSITSSAWAPSFLFSAVAISIAVFSRILPVNRVKIPWVFLAVLMSLAVAGAAVAYLLTPILFEDAETNIACIAALAMRGLPVYPDLNAAPRYILLYGPLTYLAHIPLFVAFGSTLFSFKLLGVAAFLISMTGCYQICRVYATRQASLAGLGCASVVFFRYIGVVFWGRIDPLLLALTVLSVWAALRGPVWLAALINALALSVIPNLKLSGLAYLPPLLGLLLLLRGWKVALVAFVLALLLFPLPFFLPNVSVNNYVFILRAAAGHGIVPGFLLRNIQFSLLLLAPVLLVFWSRRSSSPVSRAQLTYFILIGFGLVITSVLGAKSGAGSYHLIPYTAPILHLYFWLRHERAAEADMAFASLAPAWILTTVLLSSTHLRIVVHEFRDAPLNRRSIAEIHASAHAFQGRTYEIGVGADFSDPRTREAYIPAFAGQPYTLAGASIRDLQFGGIAIPESTIRYVDACATEAWLIPKGDEPFSALNSYYEKPHPAFEANFRQAFRRRYRKIGSGDLYDIWACK